MRKYFPALSSELSLPSSHLSFRGSLNPWGGGPAGVAFRIADDEKVAVAVGESIRDTKRDVMGNVVGRQRRSIITGFVDTVFTDNNDTPSFEGIVRAREVVVGRFGIR